MSKFANKIITWYSKNQRELPWRKTRDPYRIWLSEVILQQTRIEQGLPYYYRFLEEFPNLKKLAEAKEEKVLKIWQGLGYYSRARNLLKGAKYLYQLPEFPKTYSELLKVPGIGPYTASAIASISFLQPQPVIDGNVYRFIARYLYIPTPVPGEKSRKDFNKALLPLIDTERPDLFNQALMEMGSLICTPTQPKCHLCPVREGCYAWEHKLIDQLPVKKKKVAVKELYITYLAVINDGTTWLLKRPESGIWAHLYEWPNTTSENGFSTWDDLIKTTGANSGNTRIIKKFETVHILTHRRINARFYLVDISGEISFKNSSIFRVSLSEIENYAVHRLMERAITKLEIANYVSE